MLGRQFLATQIDEKNSVNYKVYFRNIRENTGIYDIHEQILFILLRIFMYRGAMDTYRCFPKVAYSLPIA